MILIEEDVIMRGVNSSSPPPILSHTECMRVIKNYLTNVLTPSREQAGRKFVPFQLFCMRFQVVYPVSGGLRKRLLRTKCKTDAARSAYPLPQDRSRTIPNGKKVSSIHT